MIILGVHKLCNLTDSRFYEHRDVNVDKEDGCESGVYDDIADCTAANVRQM